MGNRTDRRTKKAPSKTPAETAPSPKAPSPDEAKAFEILGKEAARPPEEAHAEATARGQAHVDRWADSGDALSPEDRTAASRGERAVSEATDSAPEDRSFMDLYDKSTQRGVGRLRSLGRGVAGSWPPNAVIHPLLGLPCFSHCGKTIILRWIGTYAVYRQKRFEQGWIYFEGPEWAERLGLNYEAYRNEKGRIQRGDTELAWMAEDVALAKAAKRQLNHEAMISGVKDAFSEKMDANPYVRGFEILQGTDAEINEEMKERKRYAGSRT